MKPGDLLKGALNDQGFSEAFIKQSRIMGFDSMEDILCCPPEALVNKKGFSYSWLEELAKLLSEKELLHLLQSAPGRSSG